MEDIVKETLSVPHNVYLILTSQCNLRCEHCYGNYGDCSKNELTGSDWDNIFKDLKNHNIFYLNISGGEPTCHKDFCKIVDSLIKYDLPFLLTTNGFFNNKILEKIIEAKDIILGVKISLDGYDYKTHGYIRKSITNEVNEDIFDITLHNIKKLIKNYVNVSIATCLHKGNAKNFTKMKNLILDLKPSCWYISTISLSGRAVNHNDLFASEKIHTKNYWLKLKSVCELNNIYVNFVDMPNLIKRKRNRDIYLSCPAARWFCEINSDGLVTPCPLSRVFVNDKYLVFDNIKNKNIKNIWNSQSFQKFREWQHSGCEGCKLSGSCDRCVPQSIQWLSDPLAPPPYCIMNGKSLRLKNIKCLKKKLKSNLEATNRRDYV